MELCYSYSSSGKPLVVERGQNWVQLIPANKITFLERDAPRRYRNVYRICGHRQRGNDNRSIEEETVVRKCPITSVQLYSWQNLDLLGALTLKTGWKRTARDSIATAVATNLLFALAALAALFFVPSIGPESGF